MDEQRILQRHPVAPPESRWAGRVEPDAPRPPRRWVGSTVEEVIGKMDRDLGAVPEEAYEIRET